MTSFVITNTGTIPIKVNGEVLEGDNTCRGCPIEHLEKIDAPSGSSFFISYIPDRIPAELDKETGKIITPAKELWSPDIFIGKQRLQVGERSKEFVVKSDPVDIAMDVV